MSRHNLQKLQRRSTSHSGVESDAGRTGQSGRIMLSWGKLARFVSLFIIIIYFVSTYAKLSNTGIQNMQQPAASTKNLSNMQHHHQVTPKVEAAGVEDQSESKAPSCVKTLLENNKAIIFDSILIDKSISFRILLHPLSKDKYITKKIVKNGAYEPEMDQFISRALPMNTSSSEAIAFLSIDQSHRPWAVDIGANIGFHSLHMAQRGANVISFEPAPDTAELLKCSVNELLGATAGTGVKTKTYTRGSNTTIESASFSLGSVSVIQAGASDVASEGKMSRHPDSPGMTTFGTNSTFALEELEGDDTKKVGMIRLVRVDDILAEQGVPDGRSDRLRLLKVDAEGYELRALRGLNLTRFPFQFLTFEFFPKMLRASGADPIDLLILVRDAGYKCDYNKHVGRTRDKMQEWVNGIRNHVNVFCRYESTNL